MESNKDDIPFTKCNDEKCSTYFKYLDSVIHTKVIAAPDPRDHLANERNLLTWLRTGMTLALIGFMAMLDIDTKQFAPSKSFPWTGDAVGIKTKVVSYIFVSLGLISIVTATITYFINQRKIVHRLLEVGQGWAGYTMAFFIMIFACFIMIVAITEG
ncbi:uncharacterized protein BX664DRAFT_325228 [Halteromyces radiatus]|uniref:uncharacterized protein n=1 Tax=Halteromyces radiatus TaxID=101107 RepID=UPI00222063AF|nr:uncharacterized protein BX664DRAFT_325228 [Halteromyces radiatus]KAI8096939.1 hypothetical protein BX664DRAFT_325228 [Halteromyces radiatus]